jgi:hypothetical protein
LSVVRELDPGVEDESGRAGARNGHLTELFTIAGLRQIEEVPLFVTAEHQSFEEWWEPFSLGVGPAGAYVVSLSHEEQVALREHCRDALPRRRSS